MTIKFKPATSSYILYGLTPGMEYEVVGPKELGLSPFEKDVLEQYLNGLCNVKAASMVGSSVEIVKAAQKSICAFYGVRDMEGVLRIEYERLRDAPRKAPTLRPGDLVRVRGSMPNVFTVDVIRKREMEATITDGIFTLTVPVSLLELVEASNGK